MTSKRSKRHASSPSKIYPIFKRAKEKKCNGFGKDWGVGIWFTPSRISIMVISLTGVLNVFLHKLGISQIIVWEVKLSSRQPAVNYVRPKGDSDKKKYNT